MSDVFVDWQAIEFAKEQDDEDLWDDLINYSLDKPGILSLQIHWTREKGGNRTWEKAFFNSTQRPF